MQNKFVSYINLICCDRKLKIFQNGNVGKLTYRHCLLQCVINELNKYNGCFVLFRPIKHLFLFCNAINEIITRFGKIFGE